MATVGGTILSIIVMSIPGRRELLDRILGIIKPQLTKKVELLVSVTGIEEVVGAKRQRLKQAACGDFICFVDDDDMVAEDYVSQILAAIEENPTIDCVGFKGTIESPNGKICQVSYSLRNKNRIGRDNDEFFCGMGHLTPIRKEIAKSVRFVDKNAGEDSDYCKEVMDKLRSECFINKVLYRYLARYNV
jgi:hypothetical protein